MQLTQSQQKNLQDQTLTLQKKQINSQSSSETCIEKLVSKESRQKKRNKSRRKNEWNGKQQRKTNEIKKFLKNKIDKSRNIDKNF